MNNRKREAMVFYIGVFLGAIDRVKEAKNEQDREYALDNLYGFAERIEADMRILNAEPD